MARPLTFPGAIYDGNGCNLDGSACDLQEGELDAYPHRCLVTDRDRAPVARAWVLADDVAPGAVPPALLQT